MRLTREEIDKGILDTAAGIFAQQGFAHTSVQQIADAVGYSKPGLLHRFGSKEAMYRAGLAAGTDLVDDIVARGVAIPRDDHRTRAVLELLASEALQHAGMVQMLMRAFEPADSGPGAEEIRALGYRILALIDPPFATPVERLRVVLALQVIADAALAQSKVVSFDVSVPAQHLVPLVADLSLLVLSGTQVRVPTLG